MLTNTFCHVPKISGSVECDLWRSGIRHWDSFDAAKVDWLSTAKQDILEKYLEQSSRELERKNIAFFSDLLPSNEHWRLFPEFKDSVAYVDIETTGLSPEWCQITTIALYDGRDIKWYVQGRNLKDFKRDIAQYKLLVTFNGKCFDVPFINRRLRMDLNIPHIDLRYVLKSLGYTGGLKRCERRLGIDRGKLEDVDGYMAVLLWREFKKTENEKALETLLAYNILDVVNLDTIMHKAYNAKVKKTPFKKDLTLREPTPPANPFRPDTRLLAKLTEQYFGDW